MSRWELELEQDAGLAHRQLVRDNSTPMYEQLCHALTGDIATRRLAPGHRLPGEHGLCSLYGVSRTVVRQALAQLEREGAVRRVKGKGTYVARPKVSEGLLHTLGGLYAEVESRGGTVRSAVRSQQLVPAPPGAAEALRLAEGTRVVELERLRYVEESPWSLTTTYLPARFAPIVLEADLRSRSLYALLEEHGVRAERGMRSVEACVATPAQADALGTSAGRPLMRLKSLTFDRPGTPIEYFIAYHRADQSRFEFEIHASSPELNHSLRHVEGRAVAAENAG